MPSRPRVFRSAHSQLEPTVDEARGTSRERGYSAQWDKAAKLYRRSHPLCIGCEALGRVMVAEVVDHVIPHKGDQGLFWDQSNWQSSCDAHHVQIKPRLEKLFAQGRITRSDLRLDGAVAQKLSFELLV
jgi:5-methylcytosine-specific restriction enzyme A